MPGIVKLSLFYLVYTMFLQTTNATISLNSAISTLYQYTQINNNLNSYQPDKHISQNSTPISLKALMPLMPPIPLMPLIFQMPLIPLLPQIPQIPLTPLIPLSPLTPLGPLMPLIPLLPLTPFMPIIQHLFCLY